MTCSCCGLNFKTKLGLSVHHSKIHPDKPKICHKCGIALSIINWLPSHKRRHHNICHNCVKIKDRIRGKKLRKELRQEVIIAYGNNCACCGETEPLFLSIDHINGGGKKDRGRFSNIRQFYLWLKDNNFPKKEYQLLCHNCNLAKGFYGQCPHQIKKEEICQK